MSIKAY